jgi:hypothetical protein
MNSCYLCHLHSYVFSLFSDSSASLYLIHLFWDNQMSENRRRFVVRSFLVFYEYLPMVWRSLCLLPVLPDSRSCPL